ncbi:tyrosine-type recombinase/integrase [Actinotalea sp.]|uniref:tyrosine-type recombinase/integrase n=1 Tax=Actinotalea sp. TaxID=1872145 RepID=UPI003562C2D2
MAKRQNSEGTYSRRPNGTWQARLGFTDEDGRRRRVSVYGATQAEAREKLAEARARIAEGRPVRDARMTVAAWSDHWVANTLAASSRRPATKSLMLSILEKQVKPTALGRTPLARLRPSHIDAWVIELRNRIRERRGPGDEPMRTRALSDASIHRAFRVLRLLLDGAVRDGVLGKNPALAVDPPTAERKEARVLSVDEVGRIVVAAGELDALRVDRGGYRTHHRALFALIAATGIRKGEALALRWDDIDLNKGTLTIRGTLSRVDGQLVVTAPKTRASRRVLAPSAGVVAVLAAHRTAQDLDRRRAGDAWVQTGHVFTTASGRPIDPRTALRAFTVAAERAGVTGATVHTLRHSAATAMLEGGVHLKAVSDLLGHSGTQVTAEVYAHLTTPTARKAMDALGESLGL